MMCEAKIKESDTKPDTSNKKTACVIGGAGFVGMNLCQELFKRGYTVRSLDNNYLDRLQKQTDLGIETFHSDILDGWLGIYKAVEEADVVFHLAIICLPQTFKEPHYSLEVATKGLYNSLRAAREAGAFFVYCSSSEVYGSLLPAQFEFYETDPYRPTTIYGAAKASGELITQAYAYLHSLRDKYLIVRPFNCYGPWSREDIFATVVTNFVKNLLEHKPCVIHGDGEQVRDWMYVADTVDGMIHAYENRERLALQPIINICTGHPTTVNDLFELCCYAADVAPPPGSLQYDDDRHGDVRGMIGSTWYAENMLNWKAKTSLPDGLKQYVEWMRQTH
jgi:UDP-glucose 4-epimerase